MYEQIVSILARQLEAAPEEITENVDVITDLGADSLDVVDIVLALEETFGISIPDEDIASARTPKEICAYVAARKKANG